MATGDDVVSTAQAGSLEAFRKLHALYLFHYRRLRANFYSQLGQTRFGSGQICGFRRYGESVTMEGPLPCKLFGTGV